MKILIVEDEELAVKKIRKTLSEVDASRYSGRYRQHSSYCRLAAKQSFTRPDIDGY